MAKIIKQEIMRILTIINLLDCQKKDKEEIVFELANARLFLDENIQFLAYSEYLEEKTFKNEKDS